MTKIQKIHVAHARLPYSGSKCDSCGKRGISIMIGVAHQENEIDTTKENSGQVRALKLCVGCSKVVAEGLKIMFEGGDPELNSGYTVTPEAIIESYAKCGWFLCDTNFHARYKDKEAIRRLGRSGITVQWMELIDSISVEKVNKELEAHSLVFMRFKEVKKSEEVQP